MELHERLSTQRLARRNAWRQRQRSLRRAEEPHPPRARQRARPAAVRRRGQRRRPRAGRVRDRRPAPPGSGPLARRPRNGSPARSPTTSSATARSSGSSPTPRSRRSWSTDRTTSGSSGSGRLSQTTLTLHATASHLRRIITKMVGQVGRRIDESSPLVDARLPDGSRVNAIIPPLSLSGPLLTIRKFAQDRFDMAELSRSERSPRKRPTFLEPLHRGGAEHPRLGRNRLGQDDAPERSVGGGPRAATGSSRSRTRPSSSSTSGTSSGSSRARRTSRARARSRSATSSATRCACVPTGSSSARFAAPRRSTCSRR